MDVEKERKKLYFKKFKEYSKKLDKGFEITDNDKLNRLGRDYVIDASKRKHFRDEPRMID